MTRPQTTVLAALAERLATDPDGPYLDFSSAGESVKLTASEMNRLRFRSSRSIPSTNSADRVTVTRSVVLIRLSMT